MASSWSDADQRQLDIQRGVVARLMKELASYEKELAKQQERVDAMKARQEEVHEVRQQERVLDETVQMLPDTRRRLEAATEKLKQLEQRRTENATS